MFFLSKDNKTLDKKYIVAKNKKQKTLENVNHAIEYYGHGSSIQTQICCINRGCNIYDSINSLMSEMRNKEIVFRMSYYYEIANIIDAFLLAYGLSNNEEVLDKHVYQKDTPLYYDIEWIFSLSEKIQEHWEQKQLDVNNHIAKCREEQNNLKKDASQIINNSLDLNEQIKQTEEINRQLKLEHPEVSGYTSAVIIH